MKIYLLLILGVVIGATNPPSNAEVCGKAFGDSSKNQELFRIHFQKIHFKVCIEELNIMDKEMNEAKREKFCDCMKTRKDTAICEETADILHLDKCFACTKINSFHRCLDRPSECRNLCTCLQLGWPSLPQKACQL